MRSPPVPSRSGGSPAHNLWSVDGVTVITAGLPERAAEFLPRAIRSVQEQTVIPESHLIALDHQFQGAAITRNRLLESVMTPYVAVLDDDDTLYPFHLEELLCAAQRTGADVTYSDCDGHVPRNVNRDYDGALLRRTNFIPATVLFRTETVRGVGGYPVVHGEDWGLLLLIEMGGGTFHHVPRVTWTYQRDAPWSKQRSRPQNAREEVLRHVGLA